MRWSAKAHLDVVTCAAEKGLFCRSMCSHVDQTTARGATPHCRHLPLPQVNLQAAALVAIFRRESRDAVLAWLERMLPKRLPLLPGR